MGREREGTHSLPLTSAPQVWVGVRHPSLHPLPGLGEPHLHTFEVGQERDCGEISNLLRMRKVESH